MIKAAALNLHGPNWNRYTEILLQEIWLFSFMCQTKKKLKNVNFRNLINLKRKTSQLLLHCYENNHEEKSAADFLRL